MPPGVADRLRTRRSVHRLGRKTRETIRSSAFTSLEMLRRSAPTRGEPLMASETDRLLNRNLGLSCKHFRPSPDQWSRYMLRKLPQRFYFARLLASDAASAILGLACSAAARPRAISDITGALGDKVETSRARRPSARPRISTTIAIEANPKDADAALQYAKALRATGPAGPGGRGARTGHHRQPEQQGAPGRLWAGAGRQRQFPAGVRGAGPRP